MAEMREAIEQIVRDAVSEAEATEGLVVGEFVIIAAANGWNDEGEDIHQVVVIPDGGGESRILGLVEHARCTLRADIVAPSDDDY